jgi:hypothetical protein
VTLAFLSDKLGQPEMDVGWGKDATVPPRRCAAEVLISLPARPLTPESSRARRSRRPAYAVLPREDQPPGEPGGGRSERDGQVASARSTGVRRHRRADDGGLVQRLGPRRPGSPPPRRRNRVEGRRVHDPRRRHRAARDFFDEAEGVYRLVDTLSERRSVALFERAPSGFDQLMDKTIASAFADRLLHHAHVIVTEGESVRLIDATSGRGVVLRAMVRSGVFGCSGTLPRVA